jgi:hypothetical protein
LSGPFLIQVLAYSSRDKFIVFSRDVSSDHWFRFAEIAADSLCHQTSALAHRTLSLSSPPFEGISDAGLPVLEIMLDVLRIQAVYVGSAQTDPKKRADNSACSVG